MRPINVHNAIETLWKNLPVGLAKDFNTVVLYVDQLDEHDRSTDE